MKKIALLTLFLFAFGFLQAQKQLQIKVYDIGRKPIDSVKVFDLSEKLIKQADTFAFVLTVPDTTEFLFFEYKGFRKVVDVKDATSVTVVFPFYVSRKPGETSGDETAFFEIAGADESVEFDDGGVEKVIVTAHPKHTKKKRRLFRKSYLMGAPGIRTRIKSYSDEITPVSRPSIPGGANPIEPRPGLLTAGEVNDFAKWKLWQDITQNQLKQFVSVWQIYPRYRYTVQVSDTNNLPIVNARVILYDEQNQPVWAARTDNTGKAELWYNLFDTTGRKPPKKLKAYVQYGGKTYQIKRVEDFYKGINHLRLPVAVEYPDTVDIAFVIDVTGSMSDELEFLKAEISDIINKVKLNYRNLVYRVAIVVYRDKEDKFVYKTFDFTEKIDSAITFLNRFHANGGGDYPEAVDQALDAMVNKLSWADGGRTRIAFLVLDAPPHQNKTVIERLNNAIATSASQGIRIVPLSASGINKSTEYLLRSMALATNGTYTFLTDESGIGYPHIKPTTDEFSVEPMHDLFIKIIKKYIDVPPKQPEKLIKKNPDIQDTTVVGYDTIYTDTVAVSDTANNNDSTKQVIEFKDVIKFYPNPTSGKLTVEVLRDIDAFYLADMTGKLLEKHKVYPSQKIYELDISRYVNGIYFLLFFKEDMRFTGKVILIH